MPDISMCLDHNCEGKFECYRYRAVPKELYQTYSTFPVSDGMYCDSFIKIEKSNKVNTKIVDPLKS